MNDSRQAEITCLSAEQQYVQEHFRIAIGLPKAQEEELPFVPEKLCALFLRNEEYENSQRDQWGNWEFGYSENYQRGALWIPECDLWMQSQRSRLKAKGLSLAPLWPKGHDFAVCLTHDVDYIGETPTYSQRKRELLRHIKANDLTPGQKFFGSIKSLAKLALKPSSLTPNTTNTLEISYLIEKEFGVSASYFFTSLPSRHMSKFDCLYAFEDQCAFLGKPRQVQDIMQMLKQDGFDIGLHGSYNSATTKGLLQEQKAWMEKALQAPVQTTRQHWLHLSLPLTLCLQEEAGFQADTTLGFNRSIGFRAGTGLPFFAYDKEMQNRLSLIELPLTIQDGALVGNNALEYTPEYALKVVKEFTDRVKECGGCETFLFHPDIFMKAGMAALYRSIIDYCLNQNAWVTDLYHIQKWWRERAKQLS